MRRLGLLLVPLMLVAVACPSDGGDSETVDLDDSSQAIALVRSVGIEDPPQSQVIGATRSEEKGAAVAWLTQESGGNLRDGFLALADREGSGIKVENVETRADSSFLIRFTQGGRPGTVAISARGVAAGLRGAAGADEGGTETTGGKGAGKGKGATTSSSAAGGGGPATTAPPAGTPTTPTSAPATTSGDEGYICVITLEPGENDSELIANYVADNGETSVRVSGDLVLELDDSIFSSIDELDFLADFEGLDELDELEAELVDLFGEDELDIPEEDLEGELEEEYDDGYDPDGDGGYDDGEGYEEEAPPPEEDYYEPPDVGGYEDF